MNEHYLRNVIEAALLAAGRPVQPAELIQLFDENTRPTAEQVRAAIDVLAAEYAERGIELKETAGGVRIQVRRELAGEISRLWPERPARYSRALLETLALIAYRQPITRGEIESVRGVAVNPNIIKTLLERNWVRVVGTRDVPGRPELLGTTRDFLDYFGLKSLDELPPLAELKAVGDINLQLDLQGAAAEGQPAAESAAIGAAAESTETAESTDCAEPGEATDSTDSTAPIAAAGEPEEGSGADVASAAPPDDSDEALLEGSGASALDDEEDGDDSEDADDLSADGGDSHDLVAAPRDSGG
ncbi:MAG TPA: SMC-Scp complex subunit ScpB [Steroidobacteraceae bacterium]|nr:SMC-Scp complex subunit ScpB [Steroidobacteraceae bacterium]